MDDETKAKILLEMLDRQAQMLEAHQMMLVLMGVDIAESPQDQPTIQ